MVRDLDDFLGGAQTEEGLCDLIREVLRAMSGGGRLPQPHKV